MSQRLSTTDIIEVFVKTLNEQPQNVYSRTVAAFHTEILKSDMPSAPCLPRRQENSVRMLKEEYGELIDGIVAGDLVEIVDGAVDLIYVLYGLLLSCGVIPEIYMQEVALSNLEKVHDPSDPTKPVRKPEGWEEPRIRQLLLLQGWKPE